MSLEMLLKLVAVFGPVIHSTISAPPAVGVDLHAEQRFDNLCGSSDILLLLLGWVWVGEIYLV